MSGRLGTTYLDASPLGQRPGSVTEYELLLTIGLAHSNSIPVAGAT